MQLMLQGVIPEHLQEKVKTYQSGVWGRDILFNKGAYIFLQAPSGTGKTTFIHILYGIRGDYAGTVKWDNIQPGTAGEEDVAKLRAENLAIVFQDLRLFAGLTMLENIEVKRSLSDTTSKTQAEEWLHRLGIGHKKDALAHTLSFGEQQRVAIVRALVQPFDWLLMDEPFSHLDNANRDKAIALISEVVQQRQAGMLLAGLDANNYFPYSQTLLM